MNTIKKYVFFLTAICLLFSIKAEAQDTSFQKSRWDEIAKKVYFTVPQENQLKEILKTERDKIREARRAYVKTLTEEILNTDQKTRFDKSYGQIENKYDTMSNIKRRTMLNPMWIRNSFNTDGEKTQKLYKTAEQHQERIEKIRKDTYEAIGRILTPDQLSSWKSIMNQI